ncbi:hypothetical protein VNO77_00306 [Canavalia gladiata]|uniref:Uncharacterized protein n=1 Tax=Canavalia gladiata TaxID=3824 RepID=A0AAN9MPC8_CANGL
MTLVTTNPYKKSWAGKPPNTNTGTSKAEIPFTFLSSMTDIPLTRYHSPLKQMLHRRSCLWSSPIVAMPFPIDNDVSTLL